MSATLIAITPLALMENLLNPQSVLAARNQVHQLSLDVENNMFRSTWLASHVHLIELIPSMEVSLSLLAAYALTRSPRFDFPLEQWLPNIEFRTVSTDALADLIKHAISDMKEEERWPSDLLSHALDKLPTDDVEFILELRAGPEKQRPCSPLKYGPTHQMMWGSADHMYFLQVHNES